MLLQRLKDLREDKDLKQSDVANILNIAQRTYSGYETGSRMIPYSCLVKLADFYNTSTDYILELTSFQEPYPKKNSTHMRLRNLREASQFTQQQIASRLNIRQNTYSQYENGTRRIPLESLIALAKFYNTSTDYILELTDIQEPYPRK